MRTIEEFTAAESPVATAEAPNASGTVAYALFTRSLLSGLEAYTIDVRTGAVRARHAVKGPFAKYMELYYGEGTRLLPWDARGRRFLLADVDLGGAGRGNTSSPVILYSIDPSNGSSTARLLAGCTGYPVGLAWDAPRAALLLATQGPFVITFYTVDIESARARALGELPRAATEAGASHYGAYISHAHGGVAYRVGYKSVSKGKNLGVSAVRMSPAVDAAGSAASQVPRLAATWHALDLGAHGLPATVHAATDAADEPRLVGLAPREGASPASLDVVEWASNPAGGAQATLLAALNNSHPPRVPLENLRLGYVGASREGHTFGALTMAFHPSILPGVGDKWQLVTVDLAAEGSAQAAHIVPLSPQPGWTGAEGVALAGFGIVVSA